MWLSFIWPIPLAWLFLRGDAGRDDPDPIVQAAASSTSIVLMLLIVALLGAGVWYVSETLVQLSLWRFSVFVKLLTCIGAALWLTSSGSQAAATGGERDFSPRPASSSAWP